MSHVTPEKRALRPGGPTRTRADRARSEPMAVVPVGDGCYDVVAADDRVYTVDLPADACTCPDHRHRGVRCKHLRRVALDVVEGRVPAPGERAATCAACGAAFFAPEETTDPAYCAACTLRPGEAVVDRDREDLVVVVRTTDRRAAETPIPGTGYTVADYPANRAYDADDAVVEVLYPLPADLDPDDVEPRHLKTYSFPRGRLERRSHPTS
ncbi:MAG: SWIM zinc finger family protein [Halobacteriaceae archaeon]